MDIELKEQKYQLIETLGVHFEKIEALAPVAARVFSYIILNNRGTTFEELTQNLCVSKSTISTHLTHLCSLNKIKYYTKIGDRKKYYIKSYAGMVQSMDDLIEELIEKKELHREVLSYKNIINNLKETLDEEKFDLEFHSDFIEFLNKTIETATEIKYKIIK